MSVFAQPPIATYHLDCSFDEQDNQFLPIMSSEAMVCDCGIQGDAFFLDGANEDVTLDTALTTIYEGDFGISFYFEYTGNEPSVELLTSGDNCSSQNTLRIFYLPTSNEVRAVISESVLKQVSLSGNLDPGKCWHHVVYTRSAGEYELYLDGVFQESESEGFAIMPNLVDPFQLGQGPCEGIISAPFEGYIDEISFYDQHIQPFLVDDIFISYDEITTNDTTIFENDVIDLSATINCTGNIQWTPATGLASTDQFNTQVTGIETTTYIANFIGSECAATDTFQLIVIDPSDIDCKELLMPNVFTPNGDGLNDEIGIVNDFIVEEFEFMEFYDRWGELVFRTEDKSEKWDGSFQGKPANSNLFLYKAVYICGGVEHVKTGNFSILR